MQYYETETYQRDLDIAIEHIINIEQLHGKKILVTGCTGTIGSFLIDLLLRIAYIKQTGIHIYAAGRSRERILQRFSYVYSNKNTYADIITALEYNLSNDITFNHAVDYVILAAGNAHPAAFCADPVFTVVNTVSSVLKMLEYSRKHGVKRVLYLSSGEVYSNMDSMLPRACYPISKLAGENLCASYLSQTGMETVVARVCHTFGPGQTERDSRAHAQFFQKAIHGEPVVLNSNGIQKRSYLYVADCVSALLTVLINGKTGLSYDVASKDNTITIADLAKTIAELSGCQVRYEIPDDQEIKVFSPIQKQILDENRLTSLGWTSAFSIKRGVEHTLKIMKLEKGI